MAQILVRQLPDAVVERLRARAREHGRSLEAEVREILTESARSSKEEFAAIAAGWHARLAGRDFPDSAELTRLDRDEGHGEHRWMPS